MKAKVGDTVLILHSQANRDTRPHLIGGHGDFVWGSGKFNNVPDVDQETWFIPGGARARRSTRSVSLASMPMSITTSSRRLKRERPPISRSRANGTTT